MTRCSFNSDCAHYHCSSGRSSYCRTTFLDGHCDCLGKINNVQNNYNCTFAHCHIILYLEVCISVNISISIQIKKQLNHASFRGLWNYIFLNETLSTFDFSVWVFCVVFFLVLEFLKTAQNNTFNHLLSKRKSTEFRISYLLDDYREAVFRLLFSFIWRTLISTSLLILPFFVSALINAIITVLWNRVSSGYWLLAAISIRLFQKCQSTI